MVCCRSVTPRASLDHLVALRVLQSAGTDLSRAATEACRARGCFAPVDDKLAHEVPVVSLLVSLPGSRLVCGTHAGHVALWDIAAGRGAVVAKLQLHGVCVNALAVLHDGHRVAAGVRSTCDDAHDDGIVVWDTRDASRATIACDSGVAALAVAQNGWLVAGCEDGKLRVVDVDAGNVVATLTAHYKAVRAVAVLLDGRVASTAGDRKVRVWDVGTGTCIAKLAGHTDIVTDLVVLADGRLASGSDDGTTRLWDAGSGTCIRVLTGHRGAVVGLAVLPGDQLASVSADDTIRVWDTRDDACGSGGALARLPLIIPVAYWYNNTLWKVVSLPGNSLATCDGGVCLWQLPPTPHR